MTGIPDGTSLYTMISVSHFLKAVEKSSNKKTVISLETNETEIFNVQ